MKCLRFFNIVVLLASTTCLLASDAVVTAPVKMDKAPVVATANVVSVDIGRVIQEAKEFQDKRQAVEDDLKKQAKPIEDLQKKIQDAQTKMNSGDVKDDKKTELQKQLETDTRQYTQLTQSFQMTAQGAEQKFVQDVQKRIQEVGKSLGFDIVVFPGASILINEAFDGTDKLIKKLNADYKPKKSDTKDDSKTVAKASGTAKTFAKR